MALPTSASLSRRLQCNHPSTAHLHLHTARCKLHAAPLFSVCPLDYTDNPIAHASTAGKDRGPKGRQASTHGKAVKMASRRKAQYRANHLLSCAKPSLYTCRSLYPTGHATGCIQWTAASLAGPPFLLRPRCSVYRYPSCRTFPCPPNPPSSSPLPPSANTILHTHPEEAFRFFFWCELESWKWSSPLCRIKVEHREEEGRYPAGASKGRVFPFQSLSYCEYTESFLLLACLPWPVSLDIHRPRLLLLPVCRP